MVCTCICPEPANASLNICETSSLKLYCTLACDHARALLTIYGQTAQTRLLVDTTLFVAGREARTAICLVILDTRREAGVSGRLGLGAASRRAFTKRPRILN